MLYEELTLNKRFAKHRLKPNWAVDAFVEDVRLYDTWEFEEKDNAQSLNILLGCMGQHAFRTTVTSCLIDSQPFVVKYTPYCEIVEHMLGERKAYCNMKLSGVRRISWNGYEVGVVFGEKYISQLADTILDKWSDIDICAVIVMPYSVSLRTKRTDIDLGKLAALMGGGGHQKSAAFIIDKPNEQMIRTIMKLEEMPLGKEETGKP